MELTSNDIRVGATYRAKRPARVGLYGELNDRTVLWKSLTKVQYDGPSVAMGRHYPKINMDTFLAWASHEVKESEATRE